MVEERVHCLREGYCNWKMVYIGETLEVVCVDFVVHGNIGIGKVVALDVVHMVVGMVGMGWGHMEVNGGRKLVSKVVQNYVVEGVHMHVVVVVDNHNKGHHTHWIGMH